MEPKNSQDEIRCRRYRSMLLVSGNAVIAFGAWYLLRIIMDYALKTSEYEVLVDIASQEEEDAGRFLLMFIMVLFVCALLLRGYAGQAAIREARGRKKGSIYIVLGALFMLFSVFAVVNAIANPTLGEHETVIDYTVDIVIELSSLLASFDLVYSSIRMRLCEKKLKKQELKKQELKKQEHERAGISRMTGNGAAGDE